MLLSCRLNFKSLEKKKINIVTLGCSKNLVDSEKLMIQLEAGGYDLVYNSEATPAHTVIINTCGFINDAKQESVDTILSFVRKKNVGEINNLYVMGCLSERYMDDLKAEIPEASKYFGVNSMNDVLHELGLDLDRELLTDRIITGPGHYAYLKIAEGCDRTCAFCAIPAIRGKYISRPVEELVTEAKRLSEKGVREIILIAQDLSYYGLDLYKKQSLPELLDELLNIEHLEWIRLQYLYPASFPEKLITSIRENPKICSYVDIPVQHITDRMLGLMKRSHNRRETEAILHRLREEIPGAAIRTTLIAGHPGETEKDFLELKEFISDFRFNRLGVFAYSHEEGTYSHNKYKDDIPDEIREARVAELMEIQQGISSELNESECGRIRRVLIDRREGDFFIGRTEYDSPEVDQEVLVPHTYDLNPGNFYDIRITHSTDFDLFGEPVSL